MRTIDYRSDSVTQPTQAMREAMYRAEVGYDVFREDPTINRLEEMAAEISGMEAALYMPTGTMGNEIAVLSWTERGDEIILAHDSHIMDFEVGAACVLSSVGYRAIPSPDSILRPAEIRAAVRDYPADIHVARSRLLCLENALSRGTVMTPEQMKAAYDTAKDCGLVVHTDGARVFNACTALGCSIRDIARYTDSLTIHFSKGLCAPVGGVLLGPRDFIERARRNRHMLRGGLSHPGFLAAACIVALEEMPQRLAEDHKNAAYLRERLAEIPGIRVAMDKADINLVFFHWEGMDAGFLAALKAKLKENGILIDGSPAGDFRYVLHYGIEREDVDRTVELMKEGALEYHEKDH
jgi:threonine aldolase